MHIYIHIIYTYIYTLVQPKKATGEDNASPGMGSRLPVSSRVIGRG